MQHVKAVLRRAAAERGMKGNESARDTAIEMFLGELDALFTPRMVQSLEDDTIANLYEDWVRSLNHLDHEQRIEALIADVKLCAIPFLIYRKGHTLKPAKQNAAPVEQITDNVVSLHSR